MFAQHAHHRTTAARRRRPREVGKLGDGVKRGGVKIGGAVKLAAFLLALFGLAAPAADARAEASTRVFLERIDQGDETYYQYLNGTFNGVGWMNSYLATTNQPRAYCPPGDLVLSRQQQIEGLRTFIATRPRLADGPAGAAVLLFMIQSYPC